MAKYSNEKKKQKQKKNGGQVVLLVILTLLIAFLIWLVSLMGQRKVPNMEQAGQPGKTETGELQETVLGQPTEPEITEPQVLVLSDGLVIHYISKYAGIYMEDGTDEPVADVMMIILENTSEQDLQLARINIFYSDFTAEFEVTNLPAGEKVVALEKNRKSTVLEDFISVEAKNVVFFSEPMGMEEERIRITGGNGTLELENISGEDITGDIYVYYKNSASDLLYGGITYRVSVKGGLKAGESIRIIAGHYTPENSRLVLVDSGE